MNIKKVVLFSSLATIVSVTSYFLFFNNIQTEQFVSKKTSAPIRKIYKDSQIDESSKAADSKILNVIDSKCSEDSFILPEGLNEESLIKDVFGEVAQIEREFNWSNIHFLYDGQNYIVNLRPVDDQKFEVSLFLEDEDFQKKVDLPSELTLLTKDEVMQKVVKGEINYQDSVETLSSEASQITINKNETQITGFRITANSIFVDCQQNESNQLLCSCLAK